MSDEEIDEILNVEKPKEEVIEQIVNQPIEEPKNVQTKAETTIVEPVVEKPKIQPNTADIPQSTLENLNDLFS